MSFSISLSLVCQQPRGELQGKWAKSIVNSKLANNDLTVKKYHWFKSKQGLIYFVIRKTWLKMHICLFGLCKIILSVKEQSVLDGDNTTLNTYLQTQHYNNTTIPRPPSHLQKKNIFLYSDEIHYPWCSRAEINEGHFSLRNKVHYLSQIMN